MVNVLEQPLMPYLRAGHGCRHGSGAAPMLTRRPVDYWPNTLVALLLACAWVSPAGATLIQSSPGPERLLPQYEATWLTPRPNTEAAERGFRKALQLLNDGRIEAAIKKARQELEQYHDSAAGHEVLGAALAAHGDVDEGLAELRKAVAINPAQSSADT